MRYRPKERKPSVYSGCAMSFLLEPVTNVHMWTAQRLKKRRGGRRPLGVAPKPSSPDCPLRLFAPGGTAP